MSSLVTTRPMQPSDKSFIYATWLKGQFYGDASFANVAHDAFYATYPKLIDSVLSAPNTKCDILCLKDDIDVIIGYSVYSLQDCLHWVFIKKPWRGMGYAKQIAPQACSAFSGLSRPGSVIATKYNLKYKPLTAYIDLTTINNTNPKEVNNVQD